MKIFKTFSLACILVLVGFTSKSFAQNATVQAEGTVLQPLSVTATNLSFGAEIFPGIDEVVARTDAAASQFDITGETSKEITATFTLPTELTFDANTLPITFSATDGGHATASTEQGTATAFDPSGALTTTLSAAGELFLWLGGTAEPAADQAAGAYSGDITLETVYTSN